MVKRRRSRNDTVVNKRLAFWGIPGALLASLFFLYINIASFVKGEPLRGRSSSDETRSFREYGEGAFAVDHVSYLVIASWAVILVGAITVLFLTSNKIVKPESIKKLKPWLIGAGLLAVFSAGVIAIILLTSYSAQGIPYHNFNISKYASTQGTMYGISYILPIFSAGGSLALGIYLARTGGRSNSELVPRQGKDA